MAGLNDLVKKAKDVIEDRGGNDALKKDAEELKDIARSKGSLKDKAKQAAEAIKDPGAAGPDGTADTAAGRAADRAPKPDSAGGTAPGTTPPHGDPAQR